MQAAAALEAATQAVQAAATAAAVARAERDAALQQLQKNQRQGGGAPSQRKGVSAQLQQQGALLAHQAHELELAKGEIERARRARGAAAARDREKLSAAERRAAVAEADAAALKVRAAEAETRAATLKARTARAVRDAKVAVRREGVAAAAAAAAQEVAVEGAKAVAAKECAAVVETARASAAKDAAEAAAAARRALDGVARSVNLTVEARAKEAAELREQANTTAAGLAAAQAEREELKRRNARLADAVLNMSSLNASVTSGAGGRSGAGGMTEQGAAVLEEMPELVPPPTITRAPGATRGSGSGGGSGGVAADDGASDEGSTAGGTSGEAQRAESSTPQMLAPPDICLFGAATSPRRGVRDRHRQQQQHEQEPLGQQGAQAQDDQAPSYLSRSLACKRETAAALPPPPPSPPPPSPPRPRDTGDFGESCDSDSDGSFDLGSDGMSEAERPGSSDESEDFSFTDESGDCLQAAAAVPGHSSLAGSVLDDVSGIVPSVAASATAAVAVAANYSGGDDGVNDSEFSVALESARSLQAMLASAAKTATVAGAGGRGVNTAGADVAATVVQMPGKATDRAPASQYGVALAATYPVGDSRSPAPKPQRGFKFPRSSPVAPNTAKPATSGGDRDGVRQGGFLSAMAAQIQDLPETWEENPGRWEVSS